MKESKITAVDLRHGSKTFGKRVSYSPINPEDELMELNYSIFYPFGKVEKGTPVLVRQQAA